MLNLLNKNTEKIAGEDKNNNRDIVINAVALSTGIAIGPIYQTQQTRIEIEQKQILSDGIVYEVERFYAACGEAIEQLEQLKEKAQSLPDESQEEISLLFDVHLALLSESKFTRGVEKLITEENINAEYAIEREIKHYAKQFEKIRDPYLASRIRDIEEVARRVLLNLMAIEPRTLDQAKQDHVVLCDELAASDMALMNPTKIPGFATRSGGRQSHIAILARAMGMPALGGLERMPTEQESKQLAIIDGNEGQLILNPTARTLSYYREEQARWRERQLALRKYATLPAVTKNGTPIQVSCSVSQIQDIEEIDKVGGEGIGLLRTEFMYMNRDDIPHVDEQYEILAKIVQRAPEQPTTIRTMDIGGDKLTSTFQMHHEESNPVLGLRAIRLSLEQQTLLENQFEAILRVARLGRVRILLPMVTDVKQLRMARVILARTVRKMRFEGQRLPKKLPPVGIMIETPAAAIVSYQLAELSDFFAIGTNDLIQYTLAVDRTNERVAQWYTPDHPAISQLIELSIQSARDRKIPVSVCGEMAGETEYTEMLLRRGIRDLCTSPALVPEVKDMIRKLDLNDR